ncbi:MAG TPA: hypothetical protein VMW89_05720 [Desulfatiglandales bacterium]|nr:hypothetical protein [Desulfatiglandales bacterium]
MSSILDIDLDYFNLFKKPEQRVKQRPESSAPKDIKSQGLTPLADGRIRKWAKILEAGKYLRVILLEDGETVHNAFFDRSYREK